MAKFTLLEVHLDGAEFTANAPFSDRTRTSGEEEEEEGVEVEVTEEEPEAGGGRPWLAAFVGLVFLTVVALLAKRKLVSEDEPAPELDDIEA